MSSWSRVNAGFMVNEDDAGDTFIFTGDGAGVGST